MKRRNARLKVGAGFNAEYWVPRAGFRVLGCNDEDARQKAAATEDPRRKDIMQDGRRGWLKKSCFSLSLGEELASRRRSFFRPKM